MGPLLEQVLGLIERHAPWVGFILMAVIGGVVAHVREWETKYPQYTLRQHLCAVFRRTVMAVLAGGIWYLIMKAQDWLGSPYAYVGAALVGLFSPEFFDFIWALFKTWAQRITNVFIGNQPPNNNGNNGGQP